MEPKIDTHQLYAEHSIRNINNVFMKIFLQVAYIVTQVGYMIGYTSTEECVVICQQK